MLIFWKVLPIYQNNFDIFANSYIFYLKIKKSCLCKNLDIFPLMVIFSSQSNDFEEQPFQSHFKRAQDNYVSKKLILK